MRKWKLIETAPKDGTRVWVKRVYEGRIVTEGFAVFGVAHKNAPMRQPDHWPNETQKDRDDYANEPRWLKPDRMHSFPEPTHWTQTSK